jgi:acetyl esterase/lipase
METHTFTFLAFCKTMAKFSHCAVLKSGAGIAIIGAGLCVGLPSGCSTVEQIGIHFLYKKAELPESQIVRDKAYREGSSPGQRLNLFFPDSSGWPVLVFVHGGGWNSGNKDLTVGGADIYDNIGRFFASHGIGVAIINYRLLPQVSWPEQIEDVADATAWVASHIADYGGSPSRLFLSGHSAGAQLAARIALDPAPLEQRGLSPRILCGVIAVSGAGLDLRDAKTYELGEDIRYYEKRFRDGATGESWRQAASPISFVNASAPPFLIVYAEGESKGLQRQSGLLHEALASAGAESQIVIVPGQSHTRIVLTLSRPDKVAGPAILKFLQSASCNR